MTSPVHSRNHKAFAEFQSCPGVSNLDWKITKRIFDDPLLLKMSPPHGLKGEGHRY